MLVETGLVLSLHYYFVGGTCYRRTSVRLCILLLLLWVACDIRTVVRLYLSYVRDCTSRTSYYVVVQGRSL